MFYILAQSPLNQVQSDQSSNLALQNNNQRPAQNDRPSPIFVKGLQQSHEVFKHVQW